MRRRTLNLIIGSLFVVLALFNIYNYLEQKKQSASSSNINFENEETSLKEALEISSKKAKEWNKSALLISMNSVDDTLGGSRGSSGRRFNWFVSFSAQNSPNKLTIGITKRKISEVIPTNDENGISFIRNQDIKFDTPEILKIAKLKYGLKPGEDWATGYHFTLDIIDSKVVISVIGLTKDNQFTKIFFEASSGKVLNAMYKEPVGGGLIKYQPYSNLLQISNKGMAIKGIATTNNSLMVWGDRKPREFNSMVNPFLEISKDNGLNWKEVDFHNNIYSAWFNQENVIFAVSDKDVWGNLQNISEQKRLLSLDSKIEAVDHSLKNNIAVLSKNKIYFSLDEGHKWSNVTAPATTHLMRISDSGELFVQTEDHKIYQRKAQNWKEILPLNDDPPRDFEIRNKSLIVNTNAGSVWNLNPDDNVWSKIPYVNPISTLIEKGNNFFAISSDGTLLNLKEGGFFKEPLSEKVKPYLTSQEGIFTDLTITKETIFITTVPDYIWKSF